MLDVCFFFGPTAHLKRPPPASPLLMMRGPANIITIAGWKGLVSSTHKFHDIWMTERGHDVNLLTKFFDGFF